MQLLIERGQGKSLILRRPIFKLWAKFECTAEEIFLIDKYRVYKCLLTLGKPGELKRAAIIAAIVTIFIFGIFDIMGVLVQNLGGILPIFGVCLFFIYHQIREQIRVSDILEGRAFACKTVVLLIDKEEELKKMGLVFRHLLEAMKNWGGREIVKLEPYVAPTVQMIGKPDENT